MTTKYTFEVTTVWDHTYVETHILSAYEFTEEGAREQLKYYLNDFNNNGDKVVNVVLLSQVEI